LNAISNISFTTKILLLTLAALTAWMLANDVQQQSKSDVETDVEFHQTSDYSMKNFTITIMDEAGQPSRIIKGEDMAHYPEDDSTTINMLVAHIMKPEQEIWLITSNQGDTQGKGEDILLTGNVIVTKENNNDTELRTEKLHLDTEQNTAYTDVAATFKSPNGVTDTVGFHAVLADETINLHSRVKGQYDAP